MRIIIGIIFILGLFGCGRTKDNKSGVTDSLKVSADSVKKDEFDYDSQFKLENYIVEDQTDTSKVQVIDFSCALIIDPTADQVDEMKKKEGEENFYVGADDAIFYQAQALDLIDSAVVKKEFVKKQFIKFIGVDKTWTLDIRKKNLPAWNLILFNRKKTPQPEPTISLTFEKVKEYFEK